MKIQYTIELPTGGTIRVTQAIDTTGSVSAETKPRPDAISHSIEIDEDDILLPAHFGSPLSGAGKNQDDPGTGGGGGGNQEGPGTGGGGGGNQEGPGTGGGGNPEKPGTGGGRL